MRSGTLPDEPTSGDPAEGLESFRLIRAKSVAVPTGIETLVQLGTVVGMRAQMMGGVGAPVQDKNTEAGAESCPAREKDSEEAVTSQEKPTVLEMLNEVGLMPAMEELRKQ